MEKNITKHKKPLSRGRERRDEKNMLTGKKYRLATHLNISIFLS